MVKPASPVNRIKTNTRTNLNGILRGDGLNIGTVTIGSGLSFDGTTLSATGSGGTPGGSSGQLQYNNAGSFGGLSASTVATSGTHLLLTAASATDIPLAVKFGSTTPTGNAIEIRNSSGTVLGGWGPQSVVNDSLALFLKPGTRAYYIGTYDAGGRMIFARSDSANGLTFVPDPGSVTLGSQNSTGDFIIEQTDCNTITLCPSAGGGGDKKVQFGRRYSDSSSGVGCGVECWPKTGQTIPALAVMAPGGGSTLWAIDPTGAIKAVSIADSAAPNSSLYYSTDAGKLVWKDSGGVVNNLY